MNAYRGVTKTLSCCRGAEEGEDRIAEVLRVTDSELLAHVNEDGLVRVLWNRY